MSSSSRDVSVAIRGNAVDFSVLGNAVQNLPSHTFSYTFASHHDKSCDVWHLSFEKIALSLMSSSSRDVSVVIRENAVDFLICGERSDVTKVPLK